MYRVLPLTIVAILIIIGCGTSDTPTTNDTADGNTDASQGSDVVARGSDDEPSTDSKALAAEAPERVSDDQKTNASPTSDDASPDPADKRSRDSETPATSSSPPPKAPEPAFKGQKFVIYDVRYLRDPENEEKLYIVTRLKLLTEEEPKIKTAAIIFDEDVNTELTDLTYIDGSFNVAFGGHGGTNWKITAADGKVTGVALSFTHASAQYTKGNKGVLNLTANGLGDRQYGFMIHEDFKPVSNVVTFKVGQFTVGDGPGTYREFLAYVKGEKSNE